MRVWSINLFILFIYIFEFFFFSLPDPKRCTCITDVFVFMWVCAEFNPRNELVIFILFQKGGQHCFADGFRVISPDLHCVGGEQGERTKIVGEVRVTVRHAWIKHPPCQLLGCPRQQCVYNADCTEMGSGGLWGSSNCITTSSTKVKPEPHKAPFIFSSALPISSHFISRKTATISGFSI